MPTQYIIQLGEILGDSIAAQRFYVASAEDTGRPGWFIFESELYEPQEQRLYANGVREALRMAGHSAKVILDGQTYRVDQHKVIVPVPWRDEPRRWADRGYRPGEQCARCAQWDPIDHETNLCAACYPRT